MCWLLTIGVAPAGVAALEEFGRGRAALDVHRSSNPQLTRIFPSTDVCFEITRGGCSCGLYEEPRRTDASAEHRAREKYRKKGWSEAKIDRAMKASVTAKAAHSNHIGEDRRAFQQAVEGLVRRLGSVRLFVHLESGASDEELGAVRGKRPIDLAELLSASFAPDELVEVVEGPR